MITYFAVTNFKSIKDRMMIEFIPGTNRSKKDHISEDGCLRATAIFGANASGKSNFITAIKFLKRLVTDPYYSSKNPIYNWNSKSHKTTFEIGFRINGDEYDYKLSVESVGSLNDQVTKQFFTFRITDEKLVVRSSGIIRILSRIKKESPDDANSFLKELDELKADLNSYENRMASLQSKTESVHKSIDTKQSELKYCILKKTSILKELENYKDITYEIDCREIVAELEKKQKNLRDQRIVLSEKRRSILNTTHHKGRDYGAISEDIKNIDDSIRLNNVKITNLRKYIKLSEELSSIKERIVKLEKKIDRLTRDEEEFNRKMNGVAFNIDETIRRIEEKRIQLNNALNTSSESRPFISTGALDLINNNCDKETAKTIITTVYQWFVSTLVILETDDFYLPLDQTNLLDNISGILRSMDVGIYGMGWEQSDYMKDSESDYHLHSKVDLIKNQISENARKQLDDCQRNSIYSSSLSTVIIKTGPELNMFSYWRGEETVRKLVTYHNYDRTGSTNVTSESDGSRRLIELASILLPSHHERVFIVDELERRLHPLLTQRFIELFLDDPKRNKQLIFSTHEFKLMSRELFRSDEIWYMTMEDGTSISIPLNELIENNPELSRRRTEKLYINDKLLPGIPHIKKNNQMMDYTVW